MTTLEEVQTERAERDRREREQYETRRRVELDEVRERTGLPVGSRTMSDDRGGSAAAWAAYEGLPKAAKELLDAADAAGWGWGTAWQVDTCSRERGGPHPFVEVAASQRGVEGPPWQVTASWHCHETGTPRFMHGLARGPRRSWYDVTVKAARELIAAHPCQPQTKIELPGGAS